MESSKTEDLNETHRFHPFLLMTTTFLYIFCSFVISPLLIKSPGTKGRNLRKNEKYQLVGYLVHSVVISCLTGYILLSGVSNWVKLSKSWLGFVTIEISFTYFVIDLTTTAVYFPSALSSDKGAALHHVLGAMGLVLGVYWQRSLLVLSIFRLISQFSVPFLVGRVYLLQHGKSDTLVYLVVFAAMIFVFFGCRIAIIPWYWMYLVQVALQGELPILVIVAWIVVSLALDSLNLYWFYSMIHTYVKYYPKDLKNLKLL